jgi:hypothetical protein
MKPYHPSPQGTSVRWPGRPALSQRLLLTCLLTAAATLHCVASERVPRWHWSNPDPHGGNLRQLLFHEGKLLQLAERGQVYSSHPIYRWVPVNSRTARDLRAAAHFDRQLIVTAEAGTVVVFDNLDTIQVIDLQTSDWLEGVAASPGEVVAVGDNGAVFRSTNGRDWQRQTVAFTTWLTGIAYAPAVPVFVAVGREGFIATSPDGRSWTPQTSGTTAHLNRVAWCGDAFVAVGEAGTVLSSATGVAWSPLASGATNSLYTVAGDGQSLLVGGQQELRMATRQAGQWVWANQITGLSSGAPSWTYLSAVQGQASGTNASYWVGGRTGMLLYGEQIPTGWGWAQESRSVRNWLWEAARTPDFYLAVGDRGNILTSTDGARWNLEWVPDALTNSIFLGVGGTTNLLLAVGNRGTIATSANQWIDRVEADENGNLITNRVNSLGIIWDAVEPRPTTNDLQAVTATASTYVVAGGQGTLLTSPDGIQWARQESGTAQFLSSLTAFPGGLVAVGEGGTLLIGTSAGTAWTPRDAETTRWLYRVRYLRDELVVVGEAGTLLHSADGERWTAADTGTAEWLNDVVWVEDRYYAAGARGTVIVSPDLANWSQVGTLSRKAIYGLSTHAGQLVAVGVEGLILRAPIAPQLTPPQVVTYLQTTNSNVFLIAGQLDQRMLLERSPAVADPASWISSAELEIWGKDGTLIYYELLVPTRPPSEFFRLKLTHD